MQSACPNMRGHAGIGGPHGSAQAPSVEAAASHAASTEASADHPTAASVRAPVKHQISQELQIYFDRVAALLRAGPHPKPADGWYFCLSDAASISAHPLHDSSIDSEVPGSKR